MRVHRGCMQSADQSLPPQQFDCRRRRQPKHGSVARKYSKTSKRQLQRRPPCHQHLQVVGERLCVKVIAEDGERDMGRMHGGRLHRANARSASLIEPERDPKRHGRYNVFSVTGNTPVAL